MGQYYDSEENRPATFKLLLLKVPFGEVQVSITNTKTNGLNKSLAEDKFMAVGAPA